MREHEPMSKDLAAVGIQADFQYQTDWPAFLSSSGKAGRRPSCTPGTPTRPTPITFSVCCFIRRARNYMGYSNPNVDNLLGQARSEREVSRRVELYRRAEQLIMDDAVVLPVWHYSYERIFQPYVRSVEVNGLGDPYILMRKIWLDAAR